MQRCSATSLNANAWLLPSADGSEQRADRWEDLDWTLAKHGATARQEEEIHDKIFTELAIDNELGHGTFGIAFACRFPALSNETLTVKLPLSLFLDPAALIIDQNRLKLGYNSATRHKAAVASFNVEFRTFEHIYDPRSLHAPTSFKGGQLASGIDWHRHQRMLAEINKMKLHTGRAHIHRIIHYDASIPAIFSETCNGTLQTLRQLNSHNLFDATLQLDLSWKMSAEWLLVAKHVGSAITYMYAMGVVHLDIKSNNIFFRKRTGGSNHYMISDFGFCSGTQNTGDYSKCRTTLYYEPIGWRTRNLLQYNPTQLSLYTFAALMVTCLKLPNMMFPHSAEKLEYETYGSIDSEIAYFAQRNSTIAALFPPFYNPLSREFIARFPEWCHIVNILSWDYENRRDVNNIRLLTNFLTSVISQSADAEMSDAFVPN